MRVVLTGYAGYIGSVMTRMLEERGHAVSGIDALFFEGCDFGKLRIPVPQSGWLKGDTRNFSSSVLEGVDAIIHLAALSNDPMGELNPELTDEINHRATVRLAEKAIERGVERFIFSSSCSMYGIAPGDSMLTEESQMNPITAYAKSKVDSERDLLAMTSPKFSPTFMRNATAYGISPGMRMDLVVNNLTGWAFTTKKIKIMSDGTPWRPLVHVEDICRAFIAALEAPTEKVRGKAFNVGMNGENYQIKDIAETVGRIVPDCEIELMNVAPADQRTYRVDFSRIESELPGFKPEWKLEKGIRQLYETFSEEGLTYDDFTSEKFTRLAHLKKLIEKNILDQQLFRTKGDI